MNLLWLLVIVILVLAVVGAPNLGVWQHPYGWGPSGVLGFILVIFVVLILLGKL